MKSCTRNELIELIKPMDVVIKSNGTETTYELRNGTLVGQRINDDYYLMGEYATSKN